MVPKDALSDRMRKGGHTTMDSTVVVWGISFPLLLFFVALGAGTAFAMTSSDSIGFWVAKACFAAAAFDVIAITVYWAVAMEQKAPWRIAVPTLAALVVVPALVLSLQWLGEIKIRLSTRLFAADDPTPTIGAFVVPKKALAVFHGKNVAWSSTDMPMSVLTMAGEKMIEITKDRDRDELVISTLKIFDDRNNIIARLDDEDGIWVENSTRKKRPDKSTLVVFDHSDAEVLRLKFLNPTSIMVTGIFRHARVKQPVVITPDYMQYGVTRMSGNISHAATVVNIGADR